MKAYIWLDEAQGRVLDFVSDCGFEHIKDVSALTLVTWTMKVIG